MNIISFFRPVAGYIIDIFVRFKIKLNHITELMDKNNVLKILKTIVTHDDFMFSFSVIKGSFLGKIRLEKYWKIEKLPICTYIVSIRMDFHRKNYLPQDSFSSISTGTCMCVCIQKIIKRNRTSLLLLS